jgi:hypothetical protein
MRDDWRKARADSRRSLAAVDRHRSLDGVAGCRTPVRWGISPQTRDLASEDGLEQETSA